MLKMDKIGFENSKRGKIVSKGAKMNQKGSKSLINIPSTKISKES